MNSSVTVTLVTVNTNITQVKHHQRDLPQGSTVQVQLKEIDSQQVIEVITNTTFLPSSNFSPFHEMSNYFQLSKSVLLKQSF